MTRARLRLSSQRAKSPRNRAALGNVKRGDTMQPAAVSQSALVRVPVKPTAREVSACP